MIFEDENSEHRGETTFLRLGKQTNDHQKAFTDLLVRTLAFVANHTQIS